MSVPPTLDAAAIGDLATYLDRHASGCADHAQQIAEARATVLAGWVGDAADSFSNHTDARVDALIAMSDATSAAAAAARSYASVVASELPQAKQAEQRARAAWDAGEYVEYAQCRWQYQVHDYRLGTAAAHFASTLSARFVGNPAWLKWLGGNQDLDSLADQRDRTLDHEDRWLARETETDLESGLVDGTPDRILPPPGSSGAGTQSEESWERTLGMEFPYRAATFTIGETRAGTIYQLEDGTFVVEVDNSGQLGASIGGSGAGAGIEGSAGTVTRYHLPDRGTLDEFKARLSDRYAARDMANAPQGPYDPLEWGADDVSRSARADHQFDELYSRYQIGKVTTYGAGPTLEYDGAVGDVSGSYQMQREIDWATGEVSDIRHIEGELRGTTQVFTGGAEIDAEFRRVSDSSGDLRRVEFEATVYGEGGLSGELDALRREGLGDIVDDNPYLRGVGFRTDATAGVWGRYNVVVAADTAENAEFARRLAAMAENGTITDVIDAARSHGAGSVRFEYGGFVGSETDLSAIIKYGSQSRHHEVWYQSPELPVRR